VKDIPTAEKAKSETIRILLVEDDDGSALVLKNILERSRHRAFTVRRAGSLSAAIQEVTQGGIDLVLLDLGLPDAWGLDTFVRMHSAAAHVPIIVLTSMDDEELAATTVQQGAQDYIVKAQVDGVSLARAIRYAIERSHAQQSLMESQALVAAVVEHVPLMIFLKTAADLRFAMFNRAGEDLLGYDRKTLLGKNDLDLFPPEQAAHFMANDREVLDGNEPMVDIPEEPILTAKKGQRLLHTRKVCIVGADGSTKYLLGISEDITELKQAERELKEYREHLERLVEVRTAALEQANERLEANDKARSEFVSNVSHELKTPLASLTLALDNMLRGVVGLVPDSFRSYLAMMKQSCRRLQKTVGDVLDMTSIDAKALRLNCVKMPLSLLVQGVAESLQALMADKSLQVNLSLPKGAGFVECDRHRIERVVVNVLANAIKFTPEGGEIRITLRSDAARPGFLMLTIADNGVGIPTGDLPHVMNRYYRGDQRVDGAGLGLSISSELLRLHGGTIALTSPPPGKEKGTLISIHLPAVEPPTVFVVGGEEACSHISAQLLPHGYRAQVYRDGSEAVAAMQREAPYVALIDLSMDSLENTGTIAKIRGDADLQCVPLIALTEAGIPETKRHILAGFAIPALRRPWHENDLFTCLDRTVSGSVLL
jgi:PAS domain S-box-containing protein